MRRVTGLRRRAVVTAAMAAALSSVPALSLEHGYRWIGLGCIGIQVILVTMAFSFLVRSKRAGEPSPSEDAAPPR